VLGDIQVALGYVGLEISDDVYNFKVGNLKVGNLNRWQFESWPFESW
jgi:hypothetical protein